MSLRAPIFDVQRFSIHDGPGIRTLVFFKGCPLRCVWCQNPESHDVWPILGFQASRCRACSECAKACAHGAIRREGYRVDHAKCTVCLDCVSVCPHTALRPVGEYMTPEELLARVAVDELYYRSSGGGVTFSGGEPTLYPDFLDRMLDLCRARGFHATMETCGAFSYARWGAILPKLDLIYFDLKIMDEAHHRRATGRGNARILDNARRLVARALPVEFRLTLVPGMTDGEENLAAIAGFLTSHGRPTLHLLSYHNMGEAKIELIAGRQQKLGLANYPPDRVNEVARWFEMRGVVSIVG